MLSSLLRTPPFFNIFLLCLENHFVQSKFSSGAQLVSAFFYFSSVKAWFGSAINSVYSLCSSSLECLFEKHSTCVEPLMTAMPEYDPGKCSTPGPIVCSGQPVCFGKLVWEVLGADLNACVYPMQRSCETLGATARSIYTACNCTKTCLLRIPTLRGAIVTK